MMPRLTTTQRSSMTLTTADKGLMIFNTSSDRLEVWSGASWVTPTADNLGNHQASTILALNDNSLLLRSNSDNNHLLRWAGTSQTYDGFNVDGPVLTGHQNGVLGINNGGEQSVLTWNQSGNVGIGTQSPDERLHVNNDGPVSINFTNNTDSRGMAFHAGSGLNVLDLTHDLSINEKAYANLGDGSTIANPELYIDVSEDQVGLGTNNPQANLHLTNDFHIAANGDAWNNAPGKGIFMPYSTYGSQDGAYTQSIERSSNTYYPLELESSQLSIRALDGGATEMVVADANGTLSKQAIPAVPNSSDYIANQNATTQTGSFRINGSGTSGSMILTDVGNTVLSVENGVYFEAKNTSGVYENFLWPRWSDDRTYLNYGSGGFSVRNNSSTNTLFMSDNNRILIGTGTNPQATLHVAAGNDVTLSNNTGYFLLGDQAADNLVMDDNEIQSRSGGSASDLYIQAEGGTMTLFSQISGNEVVFEDNGRVGLGTTTPDNRLDVEGDIRLNDNTLHLRNGTDENHGLRVAGSASQFASIDPDGPALYGYSGGLLGSNQNGTEEWAIQWFADGKSNFNDDVDIDGDAAFRGMSLMSKWSDANTYSPLLSFTDHVFNLGEVYVPKGTDRLELRINCISTEPSNSYHRFIIGGVASSYQIGLTGWHTLTLNNPPTGWRSFEIQVYYDVSNERVGFRQFNLVTGN